MAKNSLAVISGTGSAKKKVTNQAKLHKKKAKVLKQSTKLVKRIEATIAQLQVMAEKFRLLK